MTPFKQAAALACVALAAGTLSACKDKTAETPRITALRSATVSTTFTTSPDSCAISLLFANKLQWLAADKTSTTPESKSLAAQFELVTVPAGQNARITIYISGFLQNAQPVANGLQLSVDGQAQSTAPLEAGAANFIRKFDVNLAPGKTVTRLNLTLNLPRPAQDADPYESQIQLDSIDIGLTDASGPKPCALPPGFGEKKT